MNKLNINTWFSEETVLDHQEDIISFIQDPDNDLEELKYNDESLVFWAAQPEYKSIFIEALKRPEISEKINDVHPNKSHTALSRSTYYGFRKIAELLLIANAAIEVEDSDGTLINAYEKLGEGYRKWPTYADDYKKIFRDLLTRDPNKPNRKFFVDKYRQTQNKAYLICIKFYDLSQSKYEDKSKNLYKNRDILTVEGSAVQRFFRCWLSIKKSGGAETVKSNLFSNVPFAIDEISSRSIIIALVDKMRRTDENDVQNAIDSSNDIWHKRRILFSAKLRLGSTQFVYDWRPTERQRGNCTFKVNGNKLDSFGDELAAILEKLTHTNGNKQKINFRTMQLGKLFLEKTKKLCTFKHEEFTYNNNNVSVRVHRDDKERKPVATLVQAQTMIHKLNGLLILWSIVEPTRRLSGHEALTFSENAIKIDHIPVATMQIRALQLLANGNITIQDIFGCSEEYDSVDYRYQNQHHHAKYGVSTGSDVVHYVDIVEEKARQLIDFDLPTPALAEKVSFLSRNYTKQLLKDGYGSGNESNDGDYSDDEANFA